MARTSAQPEILEPEAADDEVAVRPLWSGTISFGLVSIPVNLYPANRSDRAALRMLDDDGTPLRRRFYCPRTDREVPPEEIVRGYQVEPEKYVVVTDEELEALAPERTRDIDLRRFVALDQIDSTFFVRGYFLAPAGGSTKAYRLLAAVMEQRGRAGLATFVMRGKEYLVAILAENGILRAQTLRFAEEVRDPDELDLPDQAAEPRRVRQIERELARRAAAELDSDELRDRRTERILELVNAKRRRGEDVVGSPEPAEGGEDRIIDLMEVLKRNLGGSSGARQAPGKTPASSQARTTSRKSAARSATRSASGKSSAKSGARRVSGKSAASSKARQASGKPAARSGARSGSRRKRD